MRERWSVGIRVVEKGEGGRRADAEEIKGRGGAGGEDKRSEGRKKRSAREKTADGKNDTHVEAAKDGLRSTQGREVHLRGGGYTSLPYEKRNKWKREGARLPAQREGERGGNARRRAENVWE
ncbi:hypothetical protein KM043_017217 [Ampulex compressa]|nr:hypothetical protein KM043_017217 [Ampulex compressa]